MSVCVEIRTEKRVSPQEIFEVFSQKGKSLVVASDEFPCLRFGEFDNTVRGVEINEADYGYEVRICVGSNERDYLLFNLTIRVMKALTGGVVFLDEEEIKDLNSIFNRKWIDRQMKNDFRMLCTLFRPSGEAIILQGLFAPICLGYQILTSEGRDVWNYGMEDYRDLLSYLRVVQEAVRECTHAPSNLAIRNEETGEEVGVTVLHIANHKLTTSFDFVPYNPLLTIIDEDYKQQIIIPFKKFRNLIPGKGLHLFDDYQCGKCLGHLYHRKEEDPIEVGAVREMLKEGRRYVVKDIFQNPPYPGRGFDKKQRTYILMYNPDDKYAETSDEELRESIVDVWPDKGDMIWDVSDCRSMRMGDRFFIVRNGQEKNGIVMSGIFGSGAYLYTYSRQTLWTELDLNFAVDFDKHPILTTEQLQEAVPDFDWSRTYGCYKMKNDQAKKMEELFAPYFSEMLEKIDGKTVNATHYMP